jgi:hypothetical protein
MYQPSQRMSIVDIENMDLSKHQLAGLTGSLIENRQDSEMAGFALNNQQSRTIENSAVKVDR